MKYHQRSISEKAAAKISRRQQHQQISGKQRHQSMAWRDERQIGVAASAARGSISSRNISSVNISGRQQASAAASAAASNQRHV